MYYILYLNYSSSIKCQYLTFSIKSLKHDIIIRCRSTVLLRHSLLGGKLNEERVEWKAREARDNKGRIWLCRFSYWKGWPKYTVVRDQVTCTAHWYIGSGRLFERNEEAAGNLGLSCSCIAETRGRLTKSYCYLSTSFPSSFPRS